MNRLLQQQLGYTALLLAVVAQMTVAQSHSIERCYLEVDAGTCSEQIQRWYFDNRTGLCQPFTYTGCGGNANNFNGTAYCYHACNVSRQDGHSYSIEDSAAKLKETRHNQQVVGGGVATTPTDFSKQRPGLHTTRQPTLIRNAPPAFDTDEKQHKRRPVERTTSDAQETRPKRRKRETRREPRRRRKTIVDLDVGDDVAPEEKFAGDSAQRKDFKAQQYGAQRRATEQYADSEFDEYGNEYAYYGNDRWNDQVGNSFRRRRRGRGGGVSAIGELLVQMQHTVDLLERFVVAATANRGGTPVRRRPTPKNADEQRPVPATSTAEKTARAVSEFFRRGPTTDDEARAVGVSRRLPGKNTRRRGRLLHVMLLGRLGRSPARSGDRRAPRPVVAQKSQTDTSQNEPNTMNMKHRGQPEQRDQLEWQEPRVPQTSGKDDDQEDDDDDDIEVMSDRIRKIIVDPTSSFSYDNISTDDMVSLEEVLSQSAQFGTMKLVEKDEEEEEDKKEAKDSDGTTPSTPGGDRPINSDPAQPAQPVAEAITQ